MLFANVCAGFTSFCYVFLVYARFFGFFGFSLVPCAYGRCGLGWLYTYRVLVTKVCLLLDTPHGGGIIFVTSGEIAGQLKKLPNIFVELEVVSEVGSRKCQPLRDSAVSMVIMLCMYGMLGQGRHPGEIAGTNKVRPLFLLSGFFCLVEIVGFGFGVFSNGICGLGGSRAKHPGQPPHTIMLLLKSSTSGAGSLMGKESWRLVLTFLRLSSVG